MYDPEINRLENELASLGVVLGMFDIMTDTSTGDSSLGNDYMIFDNSPSPSPSYDPSPSPSSDYSSCDGGSSYDSSSSYDYGSSSYDAGSSFDSGGW